MQSYKARLTQRLVASVDIIISFHGIYDKVYFLCKSIWKNTTHSPYHIYLVDDCSPNSSFLGAFKEAPHTTCVRTEKHSGFGAALLEGLKAGLNNDKRQPGDWIVIMHSDCLIESTNWIQSLLSSYEKLMSKNVVMVSARSDNPGVKFLEGKKGEIVSDDVIPEGQYLPLFCTLVKRELFDNVGFIKSYPYAMYEDEEFAKRLTAFGLKQGVSGKTWVKHYGSATIDFLCRQKTENYRKIMESNWEKCFADCATLGKNVKK
jgi:GT2 family glycosyltransferase